MVEGQSLDGFNRVYVNDPFGNSVELMEPQRLSRWPKWSVAVCCPEWVESRHSPITEEPRDVGQKRAEQRGHDTNHSEGRPLAGCLVGVCHGHKSNGGSKARNGWETDLHAARGCHTLRK